MSAYTYSSIDDEHNGDITHKFPVVIDILRNKMGTVDIRLVYSEQEHETCVYVNGKWSGYLSEHLWGNEVPKNYYMMEHGCFGEKDYKELLLGEFDLPENP